LILDELDAPVVLAPLAGGPSTPELAAAVSAAGGLGFLAGGYLAAPALEERLARARELTDRPLAVNLFVPAAGPTDPGAYQGYVAELHRWADAAGVELGDPAYGDDDWEDKLALVGDGAARAPAVVSFTFGCPDDDVLARLREAGREVWLTVTSVEEASRAAEAGADVIVVQGSEAGGHRASFEDQRELPKLALLPALALVSRAVETPLVAAGGIATGAGMAAALCAGAHAVQLGSAFMLCPEAGTCPAHRQALHSGTPTILTRAFTGRLARGIRNRFIDEHDPGSPIAYPEIHHVTAPMRRRARETGDPELINLWAGETHELARELPAGELVAQLAEEARAALEAARRRL
jgi:nitronate monooxygenase